MKTIVQLLLASFISTTAIASNQDLFDIIDLADQIKLATRTTTANDATLQDAKLQLKKVLTLLNSPNSTPSPTQDCINFAYSKYYISNSSSVATQKAAEACKRIVDLKAAEFLFEKYYITLTASSAMDEAANRSGNSKLGKSEILSFVFDQYYISLTAVASANRASDVTDSLPVGSLPCIQNLYSKYYQTMTSVSAMDRAAKDCK